MVYSQVRFSMYSIYHTKEMKPVNLHVHTCSMQIEMFLQKVQNVNKCQICNIYVVISTKLHVSFPKSRTLKLCGVME